MLIVSNKNPWCKTELKHSQMIFIFIYGALEIFAKDAVANFISNSWVNSLRPSGACFMKLWYHRFGVIIGSDNDGQCCVSEASWYQTSLVNTGLSNVLLPIQHQAITWTNADILSNGHFRTKNNEIWIRYLFSGHYVQISITNKNTLETCKNPRPTSGWSELTVLHNINYEFLHGIFFMNSTKQCQVKTIL